MKIAVTTANGRLGSTVINTLKNEIGAANVIGIARTPSKAAHLNVEIRKGDYDSKDEFLEALKGVNSLLIVSATGDPKNRIAQHRNIIEAAKTCGVEKVVYTSIVGDEKQSSFQSVVSSNRQTEEDLRNSGLDWVIGRNGIYIEPDLEYIEEYDREGKIKNCADEGKCGYTSREELAYAYYKMLTEDKHNSSTYNLTGRSVSQRELAEAINTHYGTSLSFENMSVEDYLAERKSTLGEFFGIIIAGIYETMKNGAFDVNTDYEKAAGRKHKTLDEMILTYKRYHS